MMERQVGQMVRLVDDLLDVSRISRGKIELRRERVELAIGRAPGRRGRPAAVGESMDHDLTVTLPPQPIYLDADPTRLAQVVGNLLNNACKFTERGGRISLTVERRQGAAGGRHSGAGHRHRHRRRPAFPHLRDVHAGRYLAGAFAAAVSGIGLTLVKNLVEMHGGTVEAHSDGLGQGSEFVVRLPIAG